MLSKLLCGFVTVGCLFSAGKAEAAIFRVSDASWVANPANINESGASYLNSGGTTIAGDFHMVTKYLDSTGSVITPGNEGVITSWNIRITGGITDTFTSASGSATYAFTSGTTNRLSFSNGTNALEFTFNLTHPLTNNLGNTIEPSGSTGADANLFRETFSSTSYGPIGSLAVLNENTANGAQLDFVPFAPTAFIIIPVFSLLRKLRSPSKSI